MMAIAKGWGFWDLTHYPYGGDFKRAQEDLRVAEVLGPIKAGEVKALLLDGRKVAVKTQALITVAPVPWPGEEQCGACGATKPKGQSCLCRDNGGE
jgi:hypothetical protein